MCPPPRLRLYAHPFFWCVFVSKYQFNLRVSTSICYIAFRLASSCTSTLNLPDTVLYEASQVDEAPSVPSKLISI
jgi:hypothetical protein